MSLGKLVFDTSDVVSIEDSHSVGAYVRSGESGALITHHAPVENGGITFGFADGDVTVGTDSINETAHGLFTGKVVQLTSSGTLPAGLALATDYYVIRVDADNFKLAASAKDAENGNAVDITAAAGGGTHTVTEQERERRALDVWMMNEINVNLTQDDEITVFQGTSPWVIGDGGGSITIDGEVSLDAATLAALETINAAQSGTWTVGLSEDHNYGAVGANTLRTAAQIGNATGAADFGTGVSTAQTLRVIPATDTSFNVNDAALADTAIAHSQQAAAAVDTAESTVDSILADRKYLYLYNKGNKEIYIGGAGVNVATGFPVAVGTYLELRAGENVDVQWAAKATVGSDLRALELS